MKQIAALALALALLFSSFSSMGEEINIQALDDAALRLLLDRAQAELSARLASARADDNGYALFGDIGFRHIGYEIQDHWNEGEKKLYFDFEWINYGDSPRSFLYALRFKAFQDGIQISELAQDDGLITEKSRTHYRTEIMPGYSIKAACIFILKSESPVTIFVQRIGSEDLVFVVDPKTINCGEGEP